MIEWPDGKKFAFTIIDDTDGATVENVGPIYDLLLDCGMRTTKTVWPLAFTNGRFGGGTLQDPDYREWVLGLARRGVEIALHGTTDQPSQRPDIERGIDVFRDVIGHDPAIHVNHYGQTESIYWGDARLDGLPRRIYRLANRLAGQDRRYFGHVEDSPYFWGDICRDRVTYVRNFAFNGVNTLKGDPRMPYHDSRRPYVQYWFSASSAPDFDQFCTLLGEENQDRLVAEGGLCILYTHFAFGFVKDGRPQARAVELVSRLASLPGWFPPVSTVLDFLRQRPGWQPEVRRRHLRRMQRGFLISRLRAGTI